MSRILGWLDTGLYWIVVTLTAVLAAMGFTTVVFRYVLQSSLFWGDEFLRYLMVWLVFLGAALAARRRALITVDIFTQPMPHRVRERIAGAVALLSAAFMIYLATVSLQLVERSVGTVSASMGLPMERMYLVFPIGLGLIALNLLREAAARFRAASRDEPAAQSGGHVPDLTVHPE
jgi:TRAP-type C4-dicarboxylate transport system permease small subunit